MRRDKRKAQAPARACCLVSEILEEAGIDRARVLQIRRQVLEGIILLCQWQLSRMDRDREAPAAGPRIRKVEVE